MADRPVLAVDRRMLALDRLAADAARVAPPCPCCGARPAVDYSHRATWAEQRQAERLALLRAAVAR